MSEIQHENSENIHTRGIITRADILGVAKCTGHRLNSALARKKLKRNIITLYIYAQTSVT